MDAFARMDLEAVIADLMPAKTYPADDPYNAVDKATDDLCNLTDRGLPTGDLEDARCYLDDATDDMDATELRGIVAKASEYLSRAITALDEHGGKLTPATEELSAAVRKFTDADHDEPMDPEALLAELEYRGYTLARVPRGGRGGQMPVRARRTAPAVQPPPAPTAPATVTSCEPHLATVTPILQIRPRKPRAPRKPRIAALAPAPRIVAWGADL